MWTCPCIRYDLLTYLLTSYMLYCYIVIHYIYIISLDGVGFETCLLNRSSDVLASTRTSKLSGNHKTAVRSKERLLYQHAKMLFHANKFNNHYQKQSKLNIVGDDMEANKEIESPLSIQENILQQFQFRMYPGSISQSMYNQKWNKGYSLLGHIRGNENGNGNGNGGDEADVGRSGVPPDDSNLPYEECSSLFLEGKCIHCFSYT